MNNKLDMVVLADKIDRIAHMMGKLLASLPFCDPDIKDLEQAAAALRAASPTTAEPGVGQEQKECAKIRHRGIFIERQLQGSGKYLFICHTGISKFLPDLYPTQADAIAAVDAAFCTSPAPHPEVKAGNELEGMAAGLTDEQIEEAIKKFARDRKSPALRLTYESGPYDITMATGDALRFALAILALRSPPSGNAVAMREGIERAAIAAVPQPKLITETEALDLLKAEILKFGSQRKWCKEYLISNQYVSDILTGKVGIGKSVQAALGIKRVIMYEKVENGK